MEKLFRFRFFFKLISLFCFINSLFFIGVGIYKSAEGFIYLYKSITGSEWLSPGVHMAESLDSFMLSILFVIVAYGIYKIFVLDDRTDVAFPGWLNVRTFTDLKQLLWQTVLVTLIVFSVGLVVESNKLTWDLLISPIIILMLALSYFLMNKTDKH